MILHPSAARLDDPNAVRFGLIIGAMKAGTTSLFEVLAQHPQVCASRVKEPGFFARDSQAPEEWSDYLALWNWDPTVHRIAIEASTTYTKVPFVQGVPQRIEARSGHEFRFIYMIRDPIARIASQVRHGLYEGWGQSLDEGISDDLIAFSRYAMQLDQYVEVFPRSSVLVLTLEEFRSAPERVLARTCEFLGVAPDYEFRDPGAPRNRGDFFEVPRPIAWMAKSRAVRSVVSRLPQGIHRWLRESVAGLGAGRRRTLGRWSPNEVEREQILDLLSPDLQRLRQHYGVDIARWWGIPLERVRATGTTGA